MKKVTLNDNGSGERERIMDDKTIQNALLALWHGDPDELFNTLDGTDASSYEDAGVLTTDAGLVINTQDGRQFQITILQSR